MRYASLASGSKGNCHALCDGDRILLVDAGISFKQIQLRLLSVGWEPSRVRGLAITHEHSDHIAAIPVILKRTDWAILATKDTRQAIERIKGVDIPEDRWFPMEAGKAEDWHGWRVHPFSTSHDAVDPVAYRVEIHGHAVGVVTDLGCATALVADYCADLDLLALESNHDVQMLREGEYPAHLKSRILSRVGHLSNAASADLLSKVLSPKLVSVVLSHLSEQNNAPALARFAAQEVLANRSTILHVATQDAPLMQDLAQGLPQGLRQTLPFPTPQLGRDLSTRTTSVV